MIRAQRRVRGLSKFNSLIRVLQQKIDAVEKAEKEAGGTIQILMGGDFNATLCTEGERSNRTRDTELTQQCDTRPLDTTALVDKMSKPCHPTNFAQEMAETLVGRRSGGFALVPRLGGPRCTHVCHIAA